MTRSATRRAVRAGWLECVFSQDAQIKLLHHTRGWRRFGAGVPSENLSLPKTLSGNQSGLYRFKFPVLTYKFPVPSKKFPVLLSREFGCKPLNLLACRLSKSYHAGGFDEIP
jgi:hypothetical protein